VAETIRRCYRDLVGLYGITLPETDPDTISMRRALEMAQAPFPTPGAFPAVGEQAVMDRHVEELDRRLADLGVIAPGQATKMPAPSADEDDLGFRSFPPPIDY
jgi:hypothetical protein